jgi:hypothetical protein
MTIERRRQRVVAGRGGSPLPLEIHKSHPAPARTGRIGVRSGGEAVGRAHRQRKYFTCGMKKECASRVFLYAFEFSRN